MEQFNDIFTIEPSTVKTYVKPPEVKVKYLEPPKRLEVLNAESAGQIVKGFNELEAKAACKALVRKYPKVYATAMYNELMHHRVQNEVNLDMLKKDWEW